MYKDKGEIPFIRVSDLGDLEIKLGDSSKYINETLFEELKEKYGDQWVPVENYIPHYHEMLEEKFDNLFSKGLLLNLKTNARKIIMELIKTSDKVKEY